MKKIFLLNALLLLVCSCNSDTTTPQPKEEIEFTLDFTFAESGNMTRALGATIYSDFHDKYIESRVLTPKRYSLVFENIETGATSVQEGRWDYKDGIRLYAGEYKVIGVSKPMIKNNEICIDSLALRFEENITIEKGMTSLVLKAKHDSYMMFFDKANKRHIDYEYTNTGQDGTTIGLKSVDDVFYCFISGLNNYKQHIIYIYNTTSEIPVSFNFQSIPFEKGKYYYFNDMTNSFDIPQMEAGN